eukprot:scaffold22714_cov155-Cylindrotheca_fusiformis.AAC.6
MTSAGGQILILQYLFAKTILGMWTRYTQAGVLAALVFLSLVFDWESTTVATKRVLDAKEHERKIPVGGLPNRTSSSDKSSVAKNASAAPQSAGRNHVVSVVVQLSGEMGNNVFKMANGFCIKHLIEKKLGLGAEIILRAQENPKWQNAMRSTKAAFPKTRPFDFRKGNTKEFEQARKQQLQWLRRLKSTKKLDLSNIKNPTVLGMQNKCTTERCYLDLVQLLNQTWYMDRPVNPLGAEFSIPHVYANTLAGTYCWDLMYDELKAFLEVDTKSICKETPKPDETVFHFRNYVVEMPENAIRLGYEEMDPNMTANHLFANYTSGEKVAIVSRFQQNAGKYMKALNYTKGIEARYIDNQTGVEDFCFLLKAKREVIAVRESTFATLAAYLGDVKRARLYSLDTPERRARGWHYFAYSFKNKELRDRLIFENYNTTGEIEKMR